MFTGACDPPEKLSLALVPRSYVLCMIVKLAYTTLSRNIFFTPQSPNPSLQKAPCIDQDRSHILASQHQVEGALMLLSSEVAHPLKQEKTKNKQSAKLQNTPHLTQII